MKKCKLAAIAVVGAWSVAAQAMPPQVSENWYPNMMQRLAVMAGNPGFCIRSRNGSSWICDSAVDWD